MKTARLLLALLLFLFAAPAVPKSSPSRAKPKSTSSSKPVKVRTYQRKDGTVVQAHTRSAPGTASTKAKPAAKPVVKRATKPTPSPAAMRDGKGRINRSETAKHDFQRQHPCPANGKSAGGCSGYVIDHIKPLACGGADAPANMQWQTAAEAKAKDKWERTGCK